MKNKFGIRRERRKNTRRFLFFSTLTRMIFLANLCGLIILIVGALALNQFSRELIHAKVDNLTSQTRLITNILGDQATGIDGVPVLDEDAVNAIIRRIDLPTKARVRVYDKNAKLISDSALLDASIEVSVLGPVTPIGQLGSRREHHGNQWWAKLQSWIDIKINNLPVYKKHRQELQRNLQKDIRLALRGNGISGEQYEGDALIVTVALPVKRVQEVLGVVVFETRDVDAILASQRNSLTPIILIAIIASILSSFALTMFIALPIRKLARATDEVLSSTHKGATIPDLSARRDEIGDLSIALRDMTEGMHNRIDDIANFAADVAHEIKNPLTSLRSASDTLKIAKTKEQRAKMIDIIQSDVARMDRLVTDISKASRMDAALAREEALPLDLSVFLKNMADFYTQTTRETGVEIRYEEQDHALMRPQNPKLSDAENEQNNLIIVRALENSFGQVLRNLIDNAITFSPKEKRDNTSVKTSRSSVRLSLKQGVNNDEGMALIYVDDDGPGIPTESLKTIFERFYTQRPKGAVFGNHSGLGLAICRQIMDAHYGTVSAVNRLDGEDKIIGARFIVRIPLQIEKRMKKGQKKKMLKTKT
ncbi:MAG: histidine kinase [Robiginitomaculum sp.]|nr:MAG: histidine kinase [Robiginitomaculum sp.]